ncbi:uncharacterized protein LOC110732769 [Chenopodium quinoa]|uniref:uncharacterized protein LOC110732769 n=1 Tax=Chenopodium quinoa TaxID=63459 RepID=UPI000B774493|nr:uncharacterized protein LOC110732769 [Chenopodium quinoa]
MNPFGTLSTQYSTWPVLLTIYNLPPWLCMKSRYIMLSLLISGPKQPGNDIDVYLAPLIEDLKLLWNEGVSMYDAYSKTNFTLRAMIFCTINDFPAYGNLSGYTVKGTKPCPICEDDLEALRLDNCGKHVYIDNRRHLPEDHPFRKNKRGFNGKVEMREVRGPLRASEVYMRVKDIENEFGKPYKSKSKGGYKKKSELWSLPYWRHLEVRHCLDVMHIEKNVCDAIVGTLLNMPGKQRVELSKVINPCILDDLQADIIETMCRFEMYFPPSFFDVMPHLVIHLVREIKLFGPVCMRYMYPFERLMGDLKGKVMNPAKPEASIVQRTTAEEVVAWVAQFLASAQKIRLPQSRHDGRLGGEGIVGRKRFSMGCDMKNKAELFVLQSLSEVHPYLNEHMIFLKNEYPSKTDLQLIKEHNCSFLTWFKDRVMSQLSTTPNDVSDTLRWLAYGSKCQVISYEGYDINGYSFYTSRQDDKTTMQNSGVKVIGLSSEFVSKHDKTLVDRKKFYYGVIEEIIELDYVDFKMPLFRCKWADISRGVKKDEQGNLTLVNFGRPGHLADPFILASQAKQVFYMADPANRKWSVV